MQNIESILLEYKDMVIARAHKYYILGGDTEDLIQEGMIGLFQAAQSYDESKHASFDTFAGICVERRLVSAIRSANREKHQVLNSSLSLDDESNPLPLEAGPSSDPEYQAMKGELLEEYGRKLSPFERSVLNALLEDKSYQQIAKELGKTPKSVDNAIQRIKSKLR